jgi:AraC family transcriptional regulator
MTRSAHAEYASRIHRVQDYIESRLDSKLLLEDLARVANFSPFHFHRLYRGITGESLHQFILRVRLERAASRLLAAPNEPVTNIALDCGFSGPAAFARAFRARFGMSAGDWRSADSKIREAVRKKGKAGAPSDGQDEARRFSSMPENVAAKVPAQSVRVESVAPFTVAYVRHVGPYAGDTALFGRLFNSLGAWAGPRRLIGPASKWMAVYHDNPEITEQEKLRLSVCVSVPQGTAGSGEVNTMEIPGGEYAKAHFEIDAADYGAAWDWVFGEWLPASGYQPDDRPCLENYLNQPESHPQRKHIVEIWIPVKPL